MTLFRDFYRLLYKAIRLRIWLASVLVIVLILLLALTVNNARERDIADLFSRQQLAAAQNAATKMTDIFTQVEKKITLFSYLDPEVKVLPKENNQETEILFAGWENMVNTVLLVDAEGKVRRTLLQDNLPHKTLTENFQNIKRQQKPYVSLIVFDKTPADKITQKTDLYLIWGYPIWRQKKYFSGAWIIAYSLASLIESCEKQISENELGGLWLLDEKGRVIIHPQSAFIGKNINDIIQIRDDTQVLFLYDSGRHLDVSILQRDNKKQKSVIAYQSVPMGEKKFYVLVEAPYSRVISPVRKTFVYTLFSAFVLILVIVVAGISFAFREGKRLRMREELGRLKEREAWQEKLLREKKTTDGIIDGSPIPSFVINKQHQVILWNRACEELTGYSAKDMIGTDQHYKSFYSIKRPMVVDLIVDNDIEGLNKYYGKKKVKKSEKIVDAYEAHDYFDNLGGRSRFMYFLAAPIYDEDGDIIAAVETLQDVSREEELTRSLREYAETLQNELAENIELRREIEELYNYLQSIVKSLPDKIYELDKDGIVNFVSRDRKKDSYQEFKGRHFLEFVAPADVDFVVSKWEAAKRGIYQPYELEVTGRGGRKRNLLISTTPVIGTDHYILVQRDITEFKNLEKKLYDSQKLAALGQLSAGIAHEVRNPLSSIKMSLQILEKRMNPAGNDLKRFKIAQKEVEHLEELVNNVLVFAKPVEPKRGPVDLSKVLDQVLALAEKEISDKHVDVKMAMDHIPQVTVDAAMITDALLNILRNAIDAVEENGAIKISATNLDADNPAVLIQVEDSGCGIDEEDMPHLYNPFFTRKKYGTGLGLSQVLKIIEMHKGTIDIVSEKGKGTKVSIILPCYERRRIPRNS